MQDVSKILPELKAGYFLLRLETIREKKHGCEHSQKGVGRKKTSDLIENQQKMGSYTP